MKKLYVLHVIESDTGTFFFSLGSAYEWRNWKSIKSRIFERDNIRYKVSIESYEFMEDKAEMMLDAFLNRRGNGNFINYRLD